MKLHFSIFLKLTSAHSSPQGFTLVELLVAAAISIFVVGAAGFGMMAMMEQNFIARQKTDRRIELDRALHFMTEEIYDARTLNPATFAITSSVNTIPLMRLTIPDADHEANTTTVAYYLREASPPWVGDYLLVRADNVAGAIADSDSDPNITVLADGITADAVTPPFTPPCNSSYDGVQVGGNGIQACVRNSGKAEIFLYGKLTYPDGTSRTNEYLIVDGEASAKAKVRNVCGSFVIGGSGPSVFCQPVR